MTRVAVVLLLVVVVAFAFALTRSGSEEPVKKAPPLTVQLKRLKGAPRPLARLHAQASRLLGGGPDAFQARLARLEGYPVVVNKWASWCPPCRAEFPHFQNQAMRRGKRVAFLGVDSNDNTDDAREFLEDYPVSYPTYEDPTTRVSQVFKGHLSFPATAFYDSKGDLAYVKQGAYLNEEDLVADIDRYAK